MRKLCVSLLLIFLALFISACSTTPDEDTNTTSSSEVSTEVEVTETPEVNDTDNSITVDINGSVSINFTDGISSRELTLNSEVVNIEVLVFGPNNAPYTDGTVSVVYPVKATTGTNVGSFTSLNVEVDNGKAIFNYTGPNDLESLVENNDSSSVFGFYHSSSTTTVNDYTFNYAPVEDQIILEAYSVSSSLEDSELSMGLESNKLVSFFVENNNGTKVEDSKVSSISVEVLNTQLAELTDTLGNSGDTLTFTSDNDISVNISSNTISGLVPIKVVANFTDVNDENQIKEEIFNVVVFSGPPTAMSISYAGTSEDNENAKFQEQLVVTVTDKYFNPVNTNPAITTGVIVGYAKDGNGNNIYHEPNSATTGTLNPTTKIFSANNGMDFSNVDEFNDVLATFGLGYTYDAAGKWDISTSSAANTNELAILDDYESNETRSNLGFAVGHNYRQDECRYNEWIGFIKVDGDVATLDSLGMARLTLDYDYYLAGKDVVVWVNLVGFTAKTTIEGKVGESSKITLRGNPLTAATSSVYSGANNVTYRIGIEISDTGEWYRNARFGYDVQVSDNLTITNISDSNSDLSNCVAYVDVTVTENDGEAGTIDITNIVVAEEF